MKTSPRSAYPVKLERAEDRTVLVTFPDVPEAITYGEDEADALGRAADALESALSVYIADRRDPPRASPARGRPVVGPSLRGCMKLELYRAIRAGGVPRVKLARRLGIRLSHLDRLLDPRHASRIDEIEAALAALGKRLDVALRSVA
ncbi:MAG: type II toxin-antitoxin system HicB family antitoxin [Dongiaceae bacterium]